MDKVLIIIAGMPGTGKTKFANYLSNKLQNVCPYILETMVNKYGYKVITILFDGDVEVIHKRFVERDITKERHPGLVSNGRFNDFEFFNKANQPCRDFDYGDFKIIVDTTDFSKVSYDNIIAKIINS